MNFINLDLVVEKVSQGIYQGVPTSELDNLAAETCAYMNIIHPDYSKLAARVAVSNLHKMTKTSFREVATDLYNYKDKVGRPAPLIAEDVMQIINDNAEAYEAAIDFHRDHDYDFFGFRHDKLSN